VWRLLGEYASDVGDAEGILFSDDPYVNEACDQYCESKRDAKLAEVEEYKRVNSPSKEELEARAARLSKINKYHEARYKEALEESNNT
jgi:rubrerythrin